MNYKDKYCSLFSSVIDKQPTLVSVHDFLTDQTYKNEIERLRDTIDEDERAALKRKLPCITTSGLCQGSSKNFAQHNGLLCVDIDGKDNPQVKDWIEFVRSLRFMSNAWFCGLSAGGNGCFLVIGIKYPAKHLEHFRSIERWFYDDLNIVVDPRCANTNRLRFQSYNTPETCWFNHEAKVWKYQVTNSKEKAPALPVSPESQTETALRVQKCIEIITAQGIDITAGENWLKVGCALINEFQEAGRSMFHQVSRFHVKYTPHEADTKYSYWMTRGYRFTIRTFFYLCREAGIEYQYTNTDTTDTTDDVNPCFAFSN